MYDAHRTMRLTEKPNAVRRRICQQAKVVVTSAQLIQWTSGLFRTRIHPRFCDTDALGHVGNTVIPVWLLEGREPLLRLFSPDLDFRKATLVVVRTEIDFLAEIRFGADVEVTTAVEEIGNSSLVVRQEVNQADEARCRARTVMVNFDPATRRSRAIPDDVRRQLEEHRVAA